VESHTHGRWPIFYRTERRECVVSVRGGGRLMLGSHHGTVSGNRTRVGGAAIMASLGY
jgi:hypothetical protein